MTDTEKAIPVVLDTDVGLDVDDIWALAFMLKCPELDVKLITTSTGDTGYRAKLVAKLLQVAGREDIPIGVGIPLDDSPATHSQWLGDFSLGDYTGDVLRDGVGALCETIMSTDEMVSLVCIGPVPNIAAALAREPDLVTAAKFIGMHGSLRRGYMGAPKPMREFNVKTHALSCQAVFQASWEKVITPLDTCGTVVLTGERFQQVKNSGDAVAQAVMDNHFGWYEAVRDWPVYQDLDAQQHSSVLYDTVAIYLAFSEALLEMENLPVVVTPEGRTEIDEAGASVRCATAWRDQDAFLDLLVERLTREQF